MIETGQFTTMCNGDRVIGSKTAMDCDCQLFIKENDDDDDDDKISLL